MKLLVNLLILVMIVGLGYLLYTGIEEPIKFRNELNQRKKQVVAKLENIRTAQEVYRDIKGEFAPSFDELVNTLTYDSIPTVRVIADPNDPTNEDLFERVTSYSPAIDQIKELGIDLGDLASVPYSDNARFNMQADTLTYQSVNVPVMQCMTTYKDFMGPFADIRYSQYDDDYDPNNSIGFGSMGSPNLEGNWN